jgi:hypothetical protein
MLNQASENRMNERLNLTEFYAFARANRMWFTTVEKFRACGRPLPADAPDHQVAYEVCTFDQPALMRAFLQEKTKTGAYQVVTA